MADTLTQRERSRVMAAIRSRGNGSTELRVMTIFREHGITGWRRHQTLPGKPDLVFRRERLAVFVDGCFWHGCPRHCRMPKSREEFWKAKIARNKGAGPGGGARSAIEVGNVTSLPVPLLPSGLQASTLGDCRRELLHTKD